MEEWKDVPGYPGYKASNLGNIRGKRGRVLSQSLSKTGYYKVRPYAEKSNVIGVHILVGLAFLGAKPQPDWEIDHINRKTWDNRVENLRWTSHPQNMLNKNVYSNSTTGVRGLYHHDERGWLVVVSMKPQRYAKWFPESDKKEAVEWLENKRAELGINNVGS